MIRPKSWDFYLKDSLTKRAWESDNKPASSNDCENCGGLGIVSMFVATGGPLHSPAPSGIGSAERPIVSHWDNGVWWSGFTIVDTCPVCNGFKKDISDTPPEAPPDTLLSFAEVELAKKLASPERNSEVVRYDWQDYEDL
jgi:hypothetical protein